MAHESACSSEPDLHLVGNEKHLVFVAELSHALEVAVVRDNYSCFTLDGLDHVRANVGVLLEFCLEHSKVIVVDKRKARSERTETSKS